MFPPVHHRPEQVQPCQPVCVVMYEPLIDGPRKGKSALQDQLVGFQGNEQMIQLGEQAEDTGCGDRARQIEPHEVGFAVAGGKVRTGGGLCLYRSGRQPFHFSENGGMQTACRNA